MVVDNKVLEACVRLLDRFVSIPSVSGSEKLLAEEIASFLALMGISPEIVQLTGDSRNVYGRLRGSMPGPTIMLGGHLDTVSPASDWSSDPFALTCCGEKLLGLGASDMKGGLAAQLTVMKLLTERGCDFSGEILFVAVADEERYSAGAQRFVADCLKGVISRPNFAIFAEPHYEDIVVGATGKILLLLTFVGSGGHAARPEEGVNAVDSAARFLTILDETFRSQYESGERASYCVLRIRGGDDDYSLNIPSTCEVMLNKQLKDDEDDEEFINVLRKLFETSNIPGEMKVSRGIPCYPSYRLHEDDEWVEALTTYLGGRGFRARHSINESVSDANVIFSVLGVPTVLFGPKGSNLHKADEYVDISSLRNYMNLLYGFISDNSKS